MRKVVAQRMLQSHTEIPPVTQNTKVDVTELMQLRRKLVERQDVLGTKITVNDLLSYAAVKMLRMGSP